jgi:uncharacterized sporulation protein YeaH/YhbH (DUF444 family)
VRREIAKLSATDRGAAVHRPVRPALQQPDSHPAADGTQAVMFCLLDVSGSMDENRKNIAKRFFMLLYLFLTRTTSTSTSFSFATTRLRPKSTRTISSPRANPAEPWSRARWC